MDIVVLGCQQYLQSDLVRFLGGADTYPSWYGALAEDGIYLSVGDVQSLRDSVPDIRYCNDKARGRE